MTEATLRSGRVGIAPPPPGEATSHRHGQPHTRPTDDKPREPLGPRLWTGLALLMLTAAGAGLRFYHLDRPTLWGDEVATWGRVNGTFERLMERLSHEGFVPGHYVLYWVLGQFVQLTPWTMRLIPAVAGTLLIPAGYFLARQMFNRKVSLVAALFFATSAWSMAYSRDAKMYMHTWLFVTLSVACLMHWLRTKRGWSWWGWILAGAIASTMHVTSLIVLAIQPIMLFTHGQKKRIRDPFYFVVGVALILAFPGWYYLGFNQYIARTGIVAAPTAADAEVSDREVKWGNSGITWVQQYNEGIGPWELTLNSATGYLVGLQWPRQAMDPRGFERDAIPTWFLPLCVAVMSPLIGLLVIGALPWKGRQSEPPGARQPWWVAAMWLGLWLVVPTYGIYYCRSFPQFSPPWDPLLVAYEAIDGRWYVLVPIAVALAAVLTFVPRAAGWIAIALAAWMGASIGVAVYLRGNFWLHGWGDLLRDPRVLWPAVAVAPAVLWFYAGANTKERLTRTSRLLLGTAIVFAAAAAMYALMRYQYARHEQAGREWESIWMPRYLGIVFPAVTLVAAALLMRLPTWPIRTLAIALFVAVNLTQGLARIVVDTEHPWDRVAADLWQTRLTHKATTVALNIEAHGGHRRDWMRGWIADYYLHAVSGWVPAPEGHSKTDVRRMIHYRVDVSIDQVRRGLDNRAELNRIIVWDKFSGLAPVPDNDALLESLGDRLSRVSEETITTHQFWTWRPGDTYRRREYVRK